MNTLEKLVLYVDPSWRREDLIHSPIMNPFWGSSKAKDNIMLREQLAARHSFDSACYQITDKLADANMVFMPYTHRDARRWYPDLLVGVTDIAQKSGKPVLVDGIEDVPHPVDIPNALILRYGGYRFEMRENEIIIPTLANDLLEMYCENKLTSKHKTDIPSIGFAGWGSLTLYQFARTFTKELPDRLRGILDARYRAKKKGIFFRQKAMRVLEHSSLVHAHFIVRKSYSGHSNTASANIVDLQSQFVDNLLTSDYGLDVRGDANASTRLFEILSLGRIPVIIDTERNLPFSDEIDYSKFSLIVDFKDMRYLPQKIAAHYESLTDKAFIEMQKTAREVYVNHFRIDALMKHIVAQLRAKGIGDGIAKKFTQ